MLRKGRFDELFFVALPNQAERETICEIQIGKYRRDHKGYDLVQLSRAAEGGLESCDKGARDEIDGADKGTGYGGVSKVAAI